MVEAANQKKCRSGMGCVIFKFQCMAKYMQEIFICITSLMIQ